MSTRQINNDKISTKKFFYLIKQNNITDDEKILIMSFFKNFIISNSTFFSGDIFSKIRYNKNNLICSKKFVNRDILNF